LYLLPAPILSFFRLVWFINDSLRLSSPPPIMYFTSAMADLELTAGLIAISVISIKDHEFLSVDRDAMDKEISRRSSSPPTHQASTVRHRQSSVKIHRHRHWVGGRSGSRGTIFRMSISL
jgi:hypothetical protein